MENLNNKTLLEVANILEEKLNDKIVGKKFSADEFHAIVDEISKNTLSGTNLSYTCWEYKVDFKYVLKIKIDRTEDKRCKNNLKWITNSIKISISDDRLSDVKIKDIENENKILELKDRIKYYEKNFEILKNEYEMNVAKNKSNLDEAINELNKLVK